MQIPTIALVGPKHDEVFQSGVAVFMWEEDVERRSLLLFEPPSWMEMEKLSFEEGRIGILPQMSDKVPNIILAALIIVSPDAVHHVQPCDHLMFRCEVQSNED